MIGYKLDKAKSMFFDRKTVLSSVDRATRRVLSKFGAYVRTSAKSSIRKRKKVSDPGRPPSSRTGLLKKFIFFAYDGQKQSVVIGPVKLNGKGDAAELLEYGGTRTVQRGQWVRRGRPGRNSRGHFTAAPWVFIEPGTTLHYRARPFMGPAFEREKPKLPAMWAGSIK